MSLDVPLPVKIRAPFRLRASASEIAFDSIAGLSLNSGGVMLLGSSYRTALRTAEKQAAYCSPVGWNPAGTNSILTALTLYSSYSGNMFDHYVRLPFRPMLYSLLDLNCCQLML